jgi:abscisate beta-glucosyltransferase
LKGSAGTFNKTHGSFVKLDILCRPGYIETLSQRMDHRQQGSAHEKVTSDLEPFIVPGLPDRIELTTSQLPFLGRPPNGGGLQKRMPGSDEKSFGVMVNSFYELETAYVDYYRNELGNRAWLVGPVSLCNKNVEDKAERGQKTSVNEQTILSWLDSKELDSVLYVSFGSLARLAPEQILEIAHGLEASNHPFIWVIGKILKSTGQNGESKENLLPSGLEDRIKESRRGLTIRGWAPQLLILEHPAVGGFVTYCGWNSTLEGECWNANGNMAYNCRAIHQ